MGISNDTWNYVRARCPVSEYLDDRGIRYQRHGNRLRLKCPFPTHEDSTPSFTVYGDDNYHCFGCASEPDMRHAFNGTVFTLRSALEGITKTEALLLFAKEKKLALNDPNLEELQAAEEEANRNIGLCSEYVQALSMSPDWLNYLTEKRGLSEEAIIHFGLGLDSVKNRLMIPLYDENYKIVDFVVHDPSAQRKYLKPPDSPLFKNNSFWYNIGSVKFTPEIPDTVYVVEGYFDAMSLWDNGYKSAVAFCGAHITNDQVFSLQTVIQPDTRIVYIPDLDVTGLKSLEANFRTVRKVLRNRAGVVPLRNMGEVQVKDVNDWFAKAKQKELPETLRYYDYIVAYHLARCPNEQEIQLERINLALQYANPLEKEFAIQAIAEFFQFSESQIRDFIGLNSKVLTEFTNYFDTGQRIDSYIEYIDNLDKIRLSTGWKEIDETIRGINPGEVMGIMGRANTCKTLMATDMFHKQVQLGRDVPTIFFSLEMSRVQIQERIILQALQIEPFEQRSAGTVLEMMVRNRDPKLMSMMEQLKTLHQNLVVVDQPNLSVDDISRYIDLISTSKFGRPVEQVIVDHLHIVKSYGDSYSKTSNAIKDFRNMIKAKATAAAVILIQTSRKGGSGGEPITMDDARDSGQIEETLDFLLGVWRPELKAQAEIEKVKSEPLQILPKAKKSGTTTLKKSDGSTQFESGDEAYERARKERSGRIHLLEKAIDQDKGIVNVKLLKSRREGRDSTWVYKMNGISLEFVKKGHLYQTEFSNDGEVKNPFEEASTK